MRYTLRNKDRIATAYGEEYLRGHIVPSLDNYFANRSDEEITDAAMQEFHTTQNGEEYPLLRINDVADKDAMIEVAIVGMQYDVLRLAFLGRKKV